MASIYNIDVKVISDYCKYSPSQIEIIIRNQIENFIDENTGLSLRCQIVDIKEDLT